MLLLPCEGGGTDEWPPASLPGVLCLFEGDARKQRNRRVCR